MRRASCSIAWCSGLAAPACGIGGMRPSGAVMALSDAKGTYKSGASTEIRQKHTSPSDLSSMSMDSLHTLTKANHNVALSHLAFKHVMHQEARGV